MIHFLPPLVVEYSPGWNAHPWSRSANRISVTPVCSSHVIGAASVPSVFHVPPPSVVPTTAVHVTWPHCPSPSIQPRWGEIHDMDWAWKSAGIDERGAASGEPAARAADREPTTIRATARHNEVAGRIRERRT